MLSQAVALSYDVKIALALHSTEAMSEIARMLSELGVEVVAHGATMACLLCNQSKCPAQLIIADAEALSDDPEVLVDKRRGCDGRLSTLDQANALATPPVPIVLISNSPASPQIVGSRRIMGYLRQPFDRNDLSNGIEVVLRNQAEFYWLQQQCDTYRNLLERLRHKMGSGHSSELAKSHEGAGQEHPQGPDSSPTIIHSLPEDLKPFESIPHAVQEVDPTGRFIFSNPAHCRMHGFEPGELTGKMIWEILAGDSEQQAFRQALENRLRAAPPPLSYQTKHRRRDGRIIDVQVDWTYKRDRTGAVEGYISIVTDITQLLRDRRELQSTRESADSREIKLTEQLQAADQALQHEMDRRRTMEKALRQSRRLASLGVFAAGIAHEINNPITAGLNSAETALALSDQAAIPPQITDCIVNVVHATRRCRTIVKDLLRFASQQPTEKRPNSLNYVVRRAIEIVKKIHPNWPATLELNLTEQNLHVSLNMLEMEVVVANLIQNAMEAARENPQGQVTVATQKTEDHAFLIVSDNGCGIPPKILERIFDPFFTTRRATGGTGLGLSIVYAIVRNHDGEICVKSTEGVGTTVTIQLPRLQDENEVEMAQPGSLDEESANENEPCGNKQSNRN